MWLSVPVPRLTLLVMNRRIKGITKWKRGAMFPVPAACRPPAARRPPAAARPPPRRHHARLPALIRLAVTGRDADVNSYIRPTHLQPCRANYAIM